MTGTGTEQVTAREVSIVRTTRRARARRVLSTILHTRRALVGLILVLSMVFVSALAPILAPYDPVIPDHGPQFAPPGWDFPFGTDDFGRDMLSRVIWGGRKALVIAVAAVLLALMAGGVLGLVAGFVGRKVDQLIMRLIDILQAIPWLVLALMVVAFLGPGLWNVIIAIALPGIPGYARLVRSSVLEVREQDYVTAARAIGDGPAVDNGPPGPCQQLRAGAGGHDPGLRRDAHRRGRPELRGARYPAAGTELGTDAERIPIVHLGGAVDGGLPRSCHQLGGHRLQHSGRRVEGRPRPTHAGHQVKLI